MLETLDLSQTLPRKAYRRDLIRYQLQLRQLAYQLYLHKRAAIIVYEGLEASGKGSNIKRVIDKLDPRGYEVYGMGEPEGEDAAHPYLWQYWRRLKPPSEKQILIFNRSWYRRVLSDRVNARCPRPVWRRAYYEINDFERQLVDSGIVIAKFWIHISREEQRARFEARRQAAHKAWKLTDAAWQQHASWAAYEEAIEDMLLRTSTVAAPWALVEGNDKRHARVKVLKSLVETLSRALNYQPEDIVEEGG